jgi:hypothetical protein
LNRERRNDEQLLDLIIEHVTRRDAVELGPVIAKGLLSRGSTDRGYGMLRNHGQLEALSRAEVFTPEMLRKAMLIGATAPFSLLLSKVMVDLYATAAPLDPTEIKTAIDELKAVRTATVEITLANYPHVAVDLLAALVPRIAELNAAEPANRNRFKSLVESVIRHVRELPDDLRVEPTGRLVGALAAIDQLDQLTSYARKHIDEINNPDTWRRAEVYPRLIPVQDEVSGTAIRL